MMNIPLIQVSASMSSLKHLSLSSLPNKCFIILISDLQSIEVINFIANQLNRIPSLVVFIDERNSRQSWGYQPGLWVRYVPGRADILLTCSGDDKLRKALLRDMDASLRPVEEECNMRDKPIRVAYNIWQPYFSFDSGKLDTLSLESIFLTTMFERFNLNPIWVNAGQSWGSKDKTTGRWGGVIGLVRQFNIISYY